MTRTTTPTPPLPAKVMREAVFWVRDQPPVRGSWSVHAGRPGVSTHDRCDDLDYTHGLCTDLSQALILTATDLGHEPVIWLTRRGPLDLADVDVTWDAAVRSAGLELGVAARFIVVTRKGWSVPATGARREWVNLRRPTPPNATT